MSIDNGAISLVSSSSSSFASSINYFLSSLSSKPNPFISFHFRFLLDLKSCSTYKVISFGILRKTPFLLLFYPFIQWFGIRILFPFFLFSFSFFIQELPNSQISIFDPRKPKICTIFGTFLNIPREGFSSVTSFPSLFFIPFLSHLRSTENDSSRLDRFAGGNCALPVRWRNGNEGPQLY